jgi:hypothetical protein
MGAELDDGSGGLDSIDPTLATMLDPIVAALVNSIKTLFHSNQELNIRIAALEAPGGLH